MIRKETSSINLKIKEMLDHFGQKDINIGSISFSKKPGPVERKELRSYLIEQIKQHKDFKKYKADFKENQLLNISGKAKCSIASLSLSHTEDIGVFLFTFDKSLSIGFDIERANRVTKKVIERISLKEERDQAPEASLLWTAKEASFKCLSDKTKTLVLSDCLISNWTKEKSFYIFQCHSKRARQRAVGITGFRNGLSLAYAKIL